MTPEEAQAIFDGCLSLVVICYSVGLGIGLIIKIIRSAVE